MKELIQKAIEGGFNTHKGYHFTDVRWIGGVTRTVVDLIDNYDGGSSTICTSAEELFLNPLFWQALCKNFNDNYQCPICGDEYNVGIQSWKYHWHRFIDHLASGGDPESFFKELIE